MTNPPLFFTSRLRDSQPKNSFAHRRSQANDLALRVARTFTAQSDVLVFENAFHGCLERVSKVSPRVTPGTGDVTEWVHVLPVPDFYR